MKAFFITMALYQSEIIKQDPILKGLDRTPVFYTAHYEEIKELSPDFDLLIKGTVSPIQMIKHKTKNIYGVQFNPEYPAEGDKSGLIILDNFIKLFVIKEGQ